MFSESYSYFWSFCLFVVLSFWFSALVYLLLFISVHASSFQLIGICLEALSPFCCIFVFLSLCHCVFLSQFVLVHLSSFQFIGTRLEAFLLSFPIFVLLSFCLSLSQFIFSSSQFLLVHWRSPWYNLGLDQFIQILLHPTPSLLYPIMKRRSHFFIQKDLKNTYRNTADNTSMGALQPIKASPPGTSHWNISTAITIAQASVILVQDMNMSENLVWSGPTPHPSYFYQVECVPYSARLI